MVERVADEKPYDAGDVEAVQSARRRAKVARDSELGELRVLLGTEGGRNVLWRVLSRCGIYAPSHTGDGETAWREGKRAIGLWLLAEIQAADRRGYLTMMDEALTKEQPGG
jgi:hypothetical protein